MSILEIAQKIHKHLNTNEVPEALLTINENIDQIAEILQQGIITLGDLKRLSMETKAPDEQLAQEILRRYSNQSPKTDNEQEDLAEIIENLGNGEVKPETWKKLLKLIEE
jgi:hypothetical protein